MPKAARATDSCSGHRCFPATPIVSGSTDVLINFLPAARKGDPVLFHSCPCPPAPPSVPPIQHGIHDRSISKGSKNVFINGKAAARVGDSIDCGGSISVGSGDVFIGDTPYKSDVQKCVEVAVENNLPFMQIPPDVLTADPASGEKATQSSKNTKSTFSPQNKNSNYAHEVDCTWNDMRPAENAKKPNTVSVLVTKDGRVFRGYSSRIGNPQFEPDPMEYVDPKIKAAYEDVEQSKRHKLNHGKCSEVYALHKAIKNGAELEGAVSFAVSRKEKSIKKACDSCYPVLKSFGVIDGARK